MLVYQRVSHKGKKFGEFSYQVGYPLVSVYITNENHHAING